MLIFFLDSLVADFPVIVGIENVRRLVLQKVALLLLDDLAELPIVRVGHVDVHIIIPRDETLIQIRPEQRPSREPVSQPVSFTDIHHVPQNFQQLQLEIPQFGSLGVKISLELFFNSFCYFLFFHHIHPLTLQRQIDLIVQPTRDPFLNLSKSQLPDLFDQQGHEHGKHEEYKHQSQECP